MTFSTVIGSSADWGELTLWTGSATAETSFAGDGLADMSSMIVIGRAEDFSWRDGVAVQWKQGAKGGFGTGNLGIAAQYGSVMSVDRDIEAPTAQDGSKAGEMIAGHIGQKTEQVQINFVVHDLAREPDTCDPIRVEGKTYFIYAIHFHNEDMAAREMTVRAIRWPGLTRRRVATGIMPLPME